MATEKKTPKLPTPGSKHIKKDILVRVNVLYIIFFGIALCIFAQMIITQYGPNGSLLRNLSDSRNYQIKPIYASRGNILSHDGRILATEAPFYSLRLDFSVESLNDSIFESNVKPLSDSLSSLLGESSRHYENRLREIYSIAHSDKPGRKNQLLVDKINQLQLDRVKTFPLFAEGIGGLKTPKDTVRYRPYGSLAAYTLGNAYTHGLERSYNDYLVGYDGQNRCVRLVGNVWLPVVDSINRIAVDGSDIVTTLDIDLQDVAESSLRRQMASNSALSGTAIVMEVETGEIRAMTNLTRRSNGRITDDFNYATNSRNEPGSTFKLVSLLAILDEAGLSKDYVIYCSRNGREIINQTLVEDTHTTPEGRMTVKQMMAESSNIGFAKLIDQLYRDKPEVFVNYIKELGLNTPADIQRHKGLSAVIKDPARRRQTDWNRMTLTKMAYGYAIELTPMHTLMLYNAVANDGKMLAPVLVKEIQRDGMTVERFDAKVLNPQICPEGVLADVRECLEEVVENGTASLLKNDYYTVAGKTGTAQVAQGARGYFTADGGRDYLATLVGYFPAEAPKYSCIVTIKTHHKPGDGNRYYGSQLAGPVFKDIINYIYTLDEEWRADVQDSMRLNGTIPIKGGNLQQIYRTTSEVRIASEINTQEQGWGTVNKGSTINVNRIDIDTELMPDLKGMGLKDALYVLEQAGMRVTFEGKGGVAQQSIAPGDTLVRGNDVHLVLHPRTTQKERTENK